MGAVGQRYLRPVLHRLLRAHVPARNKGVRGRARVHVEGGLAAQPERHVGPDHPAHGALPLGVGLLCRAVAPVVITVHVTAGQIDPGLLVLQRGEGAAALHAGEGQCVEAHGALGPRCIDLLPEGFQVLLGGGVEEAFAGAPQQGGSTEVHQGAVLQDVALILHLQAEEANVPSKCPSS